MARDNSKAMAMVNKINWTLLPFKHLALMDEKISNMSRSRSPMIVQKSESGSAKHKEMMSTISSTEESYGSIMDKHNSVIKQIPIM